MQRGPAPGMFFVPFAATGVHRQACEDFLDVPAANPTPVADRAARGARR